MEHTRKELEQKREYYRTKMFRVMLELVFIFGVPALVGFFSYTFLIDRGVSTPVALSPLVFAFVFSWVVTMFRVRSVSSKLKDIDEALREQRTSMGEEI